MARKSDEALIIIDVQHDFLPGGALAVPNGDRVIPVISGMADQYACVVATQDWHPPDHISFAHTHRRQPFERIEAGYGQQILWPEHCVQHQPGADLAHPIQALGIDIIIRKGTNPAIDSYSAFCEADGTTLTGLGGFLKERGIKRVTCVGLATDFCVHASIVGAIAHGFEARVALKACQGIDIDGSLAHALEDMRKRGASILAD